MGGIPAWQHAAQQLCSLNLLPRLSYVAPSDYIGGTFPVTIRAHETTGSLSITTIKTDEVEDDEDFKATLSNPDGPDNVMIGIDTAYVTILDRTGECAVTGSSVRY